MKAAFAPVPAEASVLQAFRITSVRERGYPTRTVACPTSIVLPAEVEGIADDFFRPEMVQVKYRGEWYLVSRNALNASAILHPDRMARATSAG